MMFTGTSQHSTAEHRHRPTCVLAAFCCIALFEVCFVGNIMAACGDYVTVRGEHQAMRESYSPGTGSRVPLCQGPNCQRQAPSPAAPRPHLDRFQTEPACLTAALQAANIPGQWLFFEAPLAPSSGTPRQIEHPPRA